MNSPLLRHIPDERRKVDELSCSTVVNSRLSVADNGYEGMT